MLLHVNLRAALPVEEIAMNGGEALVKTLLNYGVDTGFCVPGESYLTVLEALRLSSREIRLVLNRHESGATFAAEAYAKATGKPGIAFVTRGPGATNASIGLHTAKQDSTPLVLFIGHVPTPEMGREAFQEIDYCTFFSPLTKKVIEVLKPDDVANATSEAIYHASSGRPGPVAVVLPEDVTEGTVNNLQIPKAREREPLLPKKVDIHNAIKLIENSKYPVIIGGEQINFEHAHGALAQFAEMSGIGVVSAFRRQDIIPHEHPANLGHFGLKLTPYQEKFWNECDLVILAGARPDGATLQGHSLLRRNQKIIHIYPDRAAFSQTTPHIALKADTNPTLKQLCKNIKRNVSTARIEWRNEIHDQHIQYAKPDVPQPVQCLGNLNVAKVIDILRHKVADDASIINDSGAFASWLHRHFAFRCPRSQIAACLGAMGYGVPGALGVKLARPNSQVITLVGDGGFLMTGQELSTAVQQKLPFTVLLFDNGMYGSIATHQYRRAGRNAMYGTVMNNVDFTTLTRAYGAVSWLVEHTDQFTNALEEALSVKDRPSVIHLKVDDRNLNANGPQMNE